MGRGAGARDFLEEAGLGHLLTCSPSEPSAKTWGLAGEGGKWRELWAVVGGTQ